MTDDIHYDNGFVIADNWDEKLELLVAALREYADYILHFNEPDEPVHPGIKADAEKALLVAADVSGWIQQPNSQLRMLERFTPFDPSKKQ